jgi:hypothetical protein
VASSISVFYLWCDASTFTCLTIKVATGNDSDRADPEETSASIQQEANYSLLNKLVLDMCRRYNNTFRTVNMDNYYTSPVVLILLRNRGIYTRGTVKKNPRMVPSQIVLTKAEIKLFPGGYVCMSVCEFAKIQAFGCNDNNPVHMLSTVDASTQRTPVVRQRGSTKLQIPSPFQSTIMGCKVLTGMISCDPDSLWNLGMGLKNITSRISWPNWISVLLM